MIPLLDLFIVTFCLGHFLALRLVLEPLYEILGFDIVTPCLLGHLLAFLSIPSERHSDFILFLFLFSPLVFLVFSNFCVPSLDNSLHPLYLFSEFYCPDFMVQYFELTFLSRKWSLLDLYLRTFKSGSFLSHSFSIGTIVCDFGFDVVTLSTGSFLSLS